MYQALVEVGGEEYFDADGTQPFNYVSVLFSCQCFGEGIAYLWKRAKSFAAIHLAAVALHYGLVFSNVPLASSSSISSAGSGMALFERRSLVMPTVSCANIFQKWTSAVLQGYPEEAADYIMCLNTEPTFLHLHYTQRAKDVLQSKAEETLAAELEELIVNSKGSEITVLFGDVGAPGSSMARGFGVLDDYFERAAVDKLLCRAAYKYISNQRNTEEGVRLYYLGGKYKEVVELLCQHLSKYMVPAPSQVGAEEGSALVSEHRNFWVDAAVQFYSAHLCLSPSDNKPPFGVASSSNRTTENIVCRDIRETGAPDLLRTFGILLNLTAFVDFTSSKR